MKLEKRKNYIYFYGVIIKLTSDTQRMPLEKKAVTLQAIA